MVKHPGRSFSASSALRLFFAYRCIIATEDCLQYILRILHCSSAPTKCTLKAQTELFRVARLANILVLIRMRLSQCILPSHGWIQSFI
jgi:hypothetical protein